MSSNNDLVETLKAGGMVPVNAKLGKEAVVDTVVARAYHHGVLPGRTVIRLTAENVTAGDDLEMATLGFGAGEDRGAVAKERKRPLGFPGWSLVNDPKNARYALDVVKEFKKQARKAKSKPGHAKDGIDAIAKTLGKTVPHFLPSFYEEAGRAFIEHGAQKYAAEMFGKARDAEAVHALEVDEQHRIDGFLEFALAGAVTTKALTQYAKELAEHHEPKLAYAHFRQLCLQRTLGGMPPWSGMAKELNKLAKAAKLDPKAEDAAFIAEIIESPALAKAAGEFWRAYAEPIAALGKANPGARGAILNLFPTGSTYNADLDDAWLELLDATGATAALVSDDAPENARPNGGRAAWFDKLTAHLARSYRNSTINVKAFELLKRMAPMLIADGKPIHCVGRWRTDLDLVELALELGVPAEPAEHTNLGLDDWGKSVALPERGRDPVLTAVHPKFGVLLETAVAGEIGDEPWDTASRGKQGFLAAKRSWIEKQIAAAETSALPALVEVLGTIRSKVKAETFAELPDLHARFAAIDLAPSLARTLRVGIIDEFGWPALEEARAELDPDGKAELSTHGGLPALVLASTTRAIAIGARGRLAVHDLVIPPKHELCTVRFIGGEFLVVMKESYDVKCYWSSAPHDIWDSEISTWSLPRLVHGATLPDGAWLEAAQPMRPGERNLFLGDSLNACDGTTSWINRWKDGQHRWYEVTAAGEEGRASFPAWLEGADSGWIEGDWRIDPNASYMYPAPGIADSPLGVKDGFVGLRARYQGENPRSKTKHELETIDGIVMPVTKGFTPQALLKLPDGDVRLPVTHETSYSDGSTESIYDPTGTYVASEIAKDTRYYRGQAAFLPYWFWHMYTPRDIAGSRRLHALTDDDARALMAAVEVTDAPAGVVTPKPFDVTAGVLAEVTHERLKWGITGLAVMAVELKMERDKLATERAPGAAQAVAVGGHDDTQLIEALGPWMERAWAHSGRAWTQIERTGEVFAAEDRVDHTVGNLPGSEFDWISFAIAPWSLAYLATAIGTPPDKRKIVAELLALLVKSLPPPNLLRAMQVHGSTEGVAHTFEVRWHDGNAYAMRRVGYRGQQYQVLEYAPDGVFKPLPDLFLDSEVRGRAGGSTDNADAVVAAVAEGKTSWSAEAAARLATQTGLTPSEATFVWAGCPHATDRAANFLPKELRETLGLKATQAAIARDGINAIPLAKKLAAIDAAGRAGVAALLDGSVIDDFAEAWKRAVGKRVAIPEELVEEADDTFARWGAPMAPASALAMIAAPADSPKLAVDGMFALAKDDGDIIRTNKAEPLVGQDATEDSSECFDADVLRTAIVYIPFVYASLPVGHSLREQAATAYDLVLARLKNPALWFDGGRNHMPAEADAAAFDRMLEGLGGEPVDGLDSPASARRYPGAIVVRSGTTAYLRVHPATLDAKAHAHVAKIAAGITSWGVSALAAIEYARGDELLAIAARITKTPVPDGGWEQNPLASTSKLVDKVAKAQELSREAAALYLQYLVLLWPTPKNLLEWNGWKPKQLEVAQEELVEKELVLEAKRERAQRGHFLPGGWEALKSPEPPMESWKLALYGTRTAEGAPQPRFRRFQALAPFHQLFERAWKRIEDGDVPRYEEVKR